MISKFKIFLLFLSYICFIAILVISYKLDNGYIQLIGCFTLILILLEIAIEQYFINRKLKNILETVKESYGFEKVKEDLTLKHGKPLSRESLETLREFLNKEGYSESVISLYITSYKEYLVKNASADNKTATTKD